MADSLITNIPALLSVLLSKAHEFYHLFFLFIQERKQQEQRLQLGEEEACWTISCNHENIFEHTMYAPRLRSVLVRDERNFLLLNSYPLCYGWKNWNYKMDIWFFFL